MREEVGSLALCALYDCSIGIVVWVPGVMSMGRVCLVGGGVPLRRYWSTPVMNLVETARERGGRVVGERRLVWEKGVCYIVFRGEREPLNLVEGG